jgi:mitogen-activated protein kinase 7
MESNLFDLLHSGRKLTRYEIAWLIYQTLRGLKYMHSAEIVHGDLRPANLHINTRDLELQVCNILF